jgi:hypothetical protein
MKKILLPIIISGVLIFPALAFGAVSYDRVPSGYNVYNPLYFSVSFSDLLSDWPEIETCNSWNLSIIDSNSQEHYTSDCEATTTTSHTFTETLDPVEYDYVSAYCYTDEACTIGDYVDDLILETNAGDVIFDVSNSGIVFTIPKKATASTTGFMGDIINDWWPFFALIIGLPLGFVVINRIKKIVPHK